MPRNIVAAKRYADSLFQLASNPLESDLGGKLQKVLEELRAFSTALEKNPKVYRFFLSPVMALKEKREMIADLQKKLPLTHKFLLVLAEADRMNCLRDIVTEFEKRCEKSSGETQVEIQIARKLSRQAMDEIKSYVEEFWGRKLSIEQKINPEILGGFIAKSQGRILDASIGAQLQNLDQQLSV